eukprot:COSAG05_NODE_3156_length_2280_cov_2.203576_1_plen_142_part_00
MVSRPYSLPYSFLSSAVLCSGRTEVEQLNYIAATVGLPPNAGTALTAARAAATARAAAAPSPAVAAALALHEQEKRLLREFDKILLQVPPASPAPPLATSVGCPFTSCLWYVFVCSTTDRTYALLSVLLRRRRLRGLCVFA